MPQTGMPEATGHKTQTLPLANDPPTHTLTAIATMEQQSPSRMARPAKSQAQVRGVGGCNHLSDLHDTEYKSGSCMQRMSRPSSGLLG